MTTTNSSKSLVVIQLAGANDPLNTVIPYADGCTMISGPTWASPPTR